MSMISELVEDLRYLERRERETGDTSHYAQWFKSAADNIEELSTKLSAAQMERSSQYYHGGWIPCEERMPEITIEDRHSEDVLVVLKWWDADITYEVGWYNASGRWNYDCENCKVIAWRPLPEPYREV